MKIEISNRLLILLAVLFVLATGAFLDYSNPPGTPPDVTFQTLFNSSKAAVGDVHITDAKMAVGLDDQLMPVQVTDVFPRDTKRVFCWFSWENAIPKMEIKADWNYIIDDVQILAYAFRLPRKKGSGGISLTMPTDKVLPVGSYRIDFIAKNKILKSLTFKVK